MLLYAKIERQLLLYEILYTSHEVTIDDLMRRLKASKKTIQRDIVSDGTLWEVLTAF